MSRSKRAGSSPVSGSPAAVAADVRGKDTDSPAAAPVVAVPIESTSGPAAVSQPAPAADRAASPADAGSPSSGGPPSAAAAPAAPAKPDAAAPTGGATAATASPANAPPARGFAAFIKWASSNTQFFSSVIIGGAGLIATSLYQCNQAKLAQRQAESQQKIATEQAINNWRIERAKILAQNLQTLTARGGDNAEQRYGVLLSLSRGNILDSDLAVTYALELGKDNPDYMASVLGNIEQKDGHHYRRLASAYLPSCSQRYGVGVHGMPICKDDQYAERSRAIAEVIADDAEPQLTEPVGRAAGPFVLLRDEREVHTSLLRMVGLFGEFTEELYERRQWSTLSRFFQESSGSALVGSLNLLMQSSDLANATDLEAAHQLFAERERWLTGYVLSPSCDPECRGRVLNIVLSHLGRGQEPFRRFLRSMLGRPRADSAIFLHRLQGRLSYCQLDPDEYGTLRDRVIVPILKEWVAKAMPPPGSAAASPAGSAAPGSGKPGAKGPAGRLPAASPAPGSGAAASAVGPDSAGAASSPIAGGPGAAAATGAAPAAAPVSSTPSAAAAPATGAAPGGSASASASILANDPVQLQIDDLLGLLSLLPQPSEPSQAWKSLLADLPLATRGRQPALFLARHSEEIKRRRAQAQSQPAVGPPSPQAPNKSVSTRKSKNFCALTSQFDDEGEDEE